MPGAQNGFSQNLRRFQIFRKRLHFPKSKFGEYSPFSKNGKADAFFKKLIFKKKSQLFCFSMFLKISSNAFFGGKPGKFFVFCVFQNCNLSKFRFSKSHSDFEIEFSVRTKSDGVLFF